MKENERNRTIVNKLWSQWEETKTKREKDKDRSFETDEKDN